MFQLRRNPDRPLRRGEEAALGGMYAEHAADGVGKLYPGVPVARGPGAGAQAFGARVDRPWQAGEGGNRAVQFRRLSVHRHDLASCR